MSSQPLLVRPSRARRAVSPATVCASQVIDVVPGIMDVLRASMRRNIGEGLSVPQFRCLGFIARNPGSSISDVAAFLGVTLATASAMVDRLARALYVRPATSSTDRRRTELTINAPGQALLDRIREGACQDMAAALGGLGEADLAALMHGLAVLRTSFSQTTGQAS